MKKILLIEDDPFLKDLYKTRLEKEGFLVETAENGQDALKKILEDNFDLILLDLILPELDGFEFLRKLKKEKKDKDYNIFVLSNLSSQQDIELSKKLGVKKYLIKAHFTPTEVIEEIKNALKTHA